MSQSQIELIARLDEARAILRQAIARFDPLEEIYPDWKVKELISHVAGWDDAVIESFRAHMDGNPPGTPAAKGIDNYNSQTVLERRSLSLEHILGEWEATRQVLRKIILEMPSDRFDAPLVLPWGPTGTVAEVCEVFIEHELEHAHAVNTILASIEQGPHEQFDMPG